MPGRYLRQVAPGERYDPTMTGVPDISVFHVGDFVIADDEVSHITALHDIDHRTRFADLAPSTISVDLALETGGHDLRDADVRNFWLNGLLSDGRAPCDVISFEQAAELYHRIITSHMC